MRSNRILIISMALIAVAGLAFAGKPVFQDVQVVNPVTSEVKNTISIPEQAVEVRPNVYKIGQIRLNGKLATGFMFIHKKEAFGKPVTTCGNDVCEKGENAKKCPQDCSGSGEEPDTRSCYGNFGRGVKWKQLEDYIVDPTNSQGLDETGIRNIVAAGIGKWEAAAQADILGDEVAGIVDGADEISPDNKNEVLFGVIDDPGAIAVTIVWGYFGGPPKNREIIEWDQVYDEVDFQWSLTGDANAMDFDNIATHELGHSKGMGDLYTSDCSEQTMYGYATEGETKKQTLEAGDIAGKKKLYK